jgi:hypothetical protein
MGDIIYKQTKTTNDNPLIKVTYVHISSIIIYIFSSTYTNKSCL